MSDVAIGRPVRRVQLDANGVLREAWALYKRLFGRSVLLGAVVLGSVHLLEALAGVSQSGAALSLVALVLGVAGIALLQGGLVEVVRGLHADGDDDASLPELIGRSGARLGTLVGVSLLAGLGIGFASLLLVVPGVILATRWALAVPVAMLEDTTARGALSRSRELVRGNGWSVFKVLFAVGILTALVDVPFTLAGAGAGPFGWWLGATTASALTAPYAAHALTVAYYKLVDPGRPVVLERGHRWASIWEEQEAAAPTPDEPAARAWAEYEARFDERERRQRGDS